MDSWPENARSLNVDDRGDAATVVYGTSPRRFNNFDQYRSVQGGHPQR